jgi:aspartate oxidase
MGASFDKGADGALHLTKEGGHSHSRIVHAADVTGREIERALLAAVASSPNINVYEHHFVVDLLTSQVSPLDSVFAFLTPCSSLKGFAFRLNNRLWLISALKLDRALFRPCGA